MTDTALKPEAIVLSIVQSRIATSIRRGKAPAQTKAALGAIRLVASSLASKLHYADPSFDRDKFLYDCGF
jgi:hypothetical protein